MNNLSKLNRRVVALWSRILPITLAAAGVSSFKAMHGEFKNMAPLRRNVTIDEVGNVAAFLLSDLASGMTGEVIYVDSGYHNCIAGVREAQGMVRRRKV